MMCLSMTSCKTVLTHVDDILRVIDKGGKLKDMVELIQGKDDKEEAIPSAIPKNLGVTMPVSVPTVSSVSPVSPVSPVSVPPVSVSPVSVPPVSVSPVSVPVHNRSQWPEQNRLDRYRHMEKPKVPVKCVYCNGTGKTGAINCIHCHGFGTVM